ncbi:hypothetical protein ABZ552_15600 [Nocardia sp. NPDC019219]|uniref:hypothetical protein n=1 Tax=Nocardia sp. NPDC019219 TaxID=3154590 RepID=UPI0033C4A3BD
MTTTRQTPDLIDKLQTAMRSREVVAIRPPAGDGAQAGESSRECAHRFERAKDQLLEEIVDEQARVDWEVALLPFRLDGEAGVGTIARDILESRDALTSLTIGPGCSVVGTPYDHAYTTGTGFSGKLDGKPQVVGATDGESAGGAAIDLFSDNRLDVSVIPAGTYSWSVLASNAVPNARSRGGLATVTFVGNNPNPSLRRVITLWDVQGLGQLHGFHGEGAIADAYTPGTGPFKVTLAPIPGSLLPGERLEVWVWAWIINSGANGVFSALTLNMPSFTVCAGHPVPVG